ncbi:protein Spindly-A [Ixodes scapularis]
MPLHRSLPASKRVLEAELAEAQGRLRETLDSLTVERAATLKAEREATELRAQLDTLQLSQVDPKQRGNSLFSEVEDRRLKQERELLSLRTRFRALHEQESSLREEVRKSRAQMAQLMAAGGRRADARQVVLLQDALARARLDIAQLTRALPSQGSGAGATSEAPSVPLSGLLEMERKKVEALERERLSLLRVQSESHVREDQLLRELHQASLKAEALEARMLKMMAQKDDCSVGRKDAAVHEQLGVVEEEPPVLRERIVMSHAFRRECAGVPSSKRPKTSSHEDKENTDKAPDNETQSGNTTRDEAQRDEALVEHGQCDEAQRGRAEEVVRKPKVAFQDDAGEAANTAVDERASLGTKRKLRRGSVVVPQQKDDFNLEVLDDLKDDF